MLGAIVGDVVGSRLELASLQSKEFSFFAPDCHISDGRDPNITGQPL